MVIAQRHSSPRVRAVRTVALCQRAQAFAHEAGKGRWGASSVGKACKRPSRAATAKVSQYTPSAGVARLQGSTHAPKTVGSSASSLAKSTLAGRVDHGSNNQRKTRSASSAASDGSSGGVCPRNQPAGPSLVDEGQTGVAGNQVMEGKKGTGRKLVRWLPFGKNGVFA